MYPFKRMLLFKILAFPVTVGLILNYRRKTLQSEHNECHVFAIISEQKVTDFSILRTSNVWCICVGTQSLIINSYNYRICIHLIVSLITTLV